ncbi:MAG: H-NS histone family protein [Rhodospirillales bacterium]
MLPKYRNPDNPEETWSGRGRQPRWVQAALAEGETLDDLAISSEGIASST